MMVDLWREVAERSLARMAEDWESQERAKVHLLDSWSRLPVEPLSFHQAFSNTSLNETLKPKSSNLANSSTELTHFPVRFRCCCLKISSSMCPWSQAFACYPAAEQIFIYTNLTKWGLTSGYKGRTRFKFRWHVVMMSSTIKKFSFSSLSIIQCSSFLRTRCSQVDWERVWVCIVAEQPAAARAHPKKCISPRTRSVRLHVRIYTYNFDPPNGHTSWNFLWNEDVRYITFLSRGKNTFHFAFVINFQI